MAGTKLQTHYREPFPDGSCRLLLIGKTGSGKSATGNTIAGKSVFKAKVGMNSETKDGQFHHVERNNLRIQIMDTPGLADTDGEDKILAEKIKKAMFAMHPGPHAMLLVLRCDRRFTDEEYNVYLALKDIFGANLSSFMIIVFTGIDELEKERLRFEDQIKDKSKCPSLHLILDDIGGRYILFNNKASEEEKERQVNKLIEKVRELVQKNGCSYFQHSFCSVLEEPVRRMIAEELRLNKDNIISSDVSSQVLCTTSSQSSGSFENPGIQAQKNIKAPGNRAPEMRKEFNDERIKKLLPLALNRPLSETPNVYTENQDSLETKHGDIPKSDHDVKVNVKDMVNRFEVKYSDHKTSKPDKPLSNFVRLPTGKPSIIKGERPMQMVRPIVPVDSTPHVFPDTEQRRMGRPAPCNPGDAESSSVQKLNFFDVDTDLSAEEQLQAFLHTTGEWLQDIEMKFGNDMDAVARYLDEVSLRQKLDPYLGEVSLKQKLVGHLDQLSALQLQQYDKTARDLESRIKEGMEKRAVKKIDQCSLM